jgi:dihydroxyacid dehydratase/phosphogluconate dehydratase
MEILLLLMRSKHKNLKISDEEFATRKANWVQPESNIKKGVLLKYIRSVSSAWMCN